MLFTTSGLTILLKALRTLEKKRVKAKEKEKYSLQTEPTLEHKALSGTDSILCATCNVYPMGVPEKGAYQPEERF